MPASRESSQECDKAIGAISDSWKVGAAQIIDLTGLEGKMDGHALEMRRLLDGALIIRILEPGCRAGIGVPATSTIADFAKALARCQELRITTAVGLYSFVRERDLVRVGYLRFEDCWLRSWISALNPVLEALRVMSIRAA